MRRSNLVILITISVIVSFLLLPSGAFALPKGSKWQNCTTADLNTIFGNSCMHQADQDISSGKPYLHMLFCGGGTNLCCTVDNTTGEVLNCRRPAGSAIMGGLQGTTITGTTGIQRRSVEGEEAVDEEAPVPSTLTPDVVRGLLKDTKKK